MKTQVSNEPDIWDAMLKMREQLMALDRKMDLVLMLVSKQSSAQSNAQQRPQAPAAKPNFVPPVKNSGQGRPVFRATCADCQKDCELPFKPSGDRPVYCKECFAKRRAGNNFKPAFVNKPQAQTSVAVTPAAAVVTPAVVAVPEAPAKKKKKLSSAKKSSVKKPAAKKKPVAKKKRK